jgi:hypothetical protein
MTTTTTSPDAAGSEPTDPPPLAPRGGEWQVFTEDWDPGYGNPATFDLDGSASFEPAEAGPPVHGPTEVAAVPLCFIDGVRRAELALWAEQAATGLRVPGLAGAYAVGAVTVRPGGQASYQGVRIGRLAIWGSGRTGDLVGRTGHRWTSESMAADDPAELLAHLQNRMRLAEGVLALDAAAARWTVVLDGPLNRIQSPDATITGYVKTHRRQIFPDAEHLLVPHLAIGARTRMYESKSDRYTCYLRVGNPGPGGSPWSGIARLEFPAVGGIDAAIDQAERLAGLLPRYAGVAHRDPRAPVNMTPVKNLERHLTRLLGPIAHASRAARDAVIELRTA